MVTAQDVYMTARSFTGTPFRHQGRTPGKALDCVGVVAKTAHALKLSDYDWVNYQRMATWANTFEKVFEDNMRRITFDEIAPGVVAIFRQERFPCHCGIIGERGNRGLSLIHAYLPLRKVVEEDFSNTEWDRPPRFMAAFAFHGVEY